MATPYYLLRSTLEDTPYHGTPAHVRDNLQTLHTLTKTLASAFTRLRAYVEHEHDLLMQLLEAKPPCPRIAELLESSRHPYTPPGAEATSAGPVNLNHPDVQEYVDSVVTFLSQYLGPMLEHLDWRLALAQDIYEDLEVVLDQYKASRAAAAAKRGKFGRPNTPKKNKTPPRDRGGRYAPSEWAEHEEGKEDVVEMLDAGGQYDLVGFMVDLDKLHVERSRVGEIEGAVRQMMYELQGGNTPRMGVYAKDVYTESEGGSDSQRVFSGDEDESSTNDSLAANSKASSSDISLR
ncbi:hypothetical protein DFH27DRAFT_616051 [Peziza echinospora]|nr:hypothetical protein DFH27DRAFT_616051 [Peziza echinospora]